jgi:hypothetical protein
VFETLVGLVDADTEEEDVTRETKSRIEALLEEFGDEPLTEAAFRSRSAQVEQQILDKYNVMASEIALAIKSGRLAECELVDDWIALRAFEPFFRDGQRGGFGAPRGDGIADSVYEAIGMLLRGLVYHEHSGGRTPEHLAGQVRRTIAILSPAIAAEIEQDGAARVYEERWDVPEWDVPERSAASAIAEDVRLGRTSQQIRDEIIGKVGMMAYSRTPEMQARYDAAVEREQITADRAGRHNHVFITITGPEGAEKTTQIARAILELLQEADVPCAMPEEPDNPFDGDSIEQLGHLRGTDTRVIIQTSSFGRST